MGSDAHFADHVGDMKEAAKILVDAGVKEEQVINTSLDKIEKYIKHKN